MQLILSFNWKYLYLVPHLQLLSCWYVQVKGNVLYLRQASYLHGEQIFFKLKWVSQFLIQYGFVGFWVKRLKKYSPKFIANKHIKSQPPAQDGYFHSYIQTPYNYKSKYISSWTEIKVFCQDLLGGKMALSCLFFYYLTFL